MKKNWRKMLSSGTSLVKIVADAAVSSQGIIEGKLIPLVILETSNRPDIDEMVRIHQHLPPGDVVSQWGQIEGEKDKIALFLNFQRPAELSIILQFDIVNQGGLVDQILAARTLYIQPGREGDRLATTVDKPKILIEVSDNFKEEWDRIFLKHIAKDMREKGLGRHQAKQAAQQFIEEWRKLGKFRMKRN
ncbi:MAG: hypothetical protein VST71_07115 [Nitrospirota bacterium]|nr:hypothetical protein [Nitrospirota bacterium]